jgi:hypothetical protein
VYLEYITSDKVNGRLTPSKGLDLTAQYIAKNLSTWKLKPRGEKGTFFQKLPLHQQRIDASRTSAVINGRAFIYGGDFITPALAPGSASGPLVYVGHGWVIPDKKINAYEGVGVRDKIMVVAGGGAPPEGMTPRDYGRSQHPYKYAQRNNAKGVILLPHFRTLSEWETHKQRTLVRGNISFAGDRRPVTPRGFYEGAVLQLELGTPCCKLPIPAIIVGPSMIEPLLTSEKFLGAQLMNGRTGYGEIKAFDLAPKKRVTFSVAITDESASANNVIAVLEGSDPVLKQEYVVIGAHYDAVGSEAGAGYAGADDNASGTVAVMAMAKAFAASERPKRSVVFMWYSGEERGLWGSRYFVSHPSVPLEKIVTYVNLDMVGRTKRADDKEGVTGADEVYVLGPKLTSTDLTDLVERVNGSYLNLRLNYQHDDLNDRERLIRRSDNYPFALKGIPIIYYFTGFHGDYHSPSDTSEKIDYRKIEKVARTAFVTTWELANSSAAPRFDKPPLK